MFLVQKPDPQRNLNLSPFCFYMLINKEMQSRRELYQELASRLSTNNFKIVLVDFDAGTQTEGIIDGSEIDIHLYRFVTMVHIVARVFPKNQDDYTFLPDTVDQLPDSPRFEERLESKLKGVLHALISFATENIKTLPGIKNIPDGMNIDQYLDSLNNEQRASFQEELQDKLKYASPEDSTQNLDSFLNFRFNRDYNRNEDGNFHNVDINRIDQGRIPATFKIVISKAKKFNADSVDGRIDISLVTDGGKHIRLKFSTKSCKMTYLLVLLSYKYSFGLPSDLYKNREGGPKVITSVWNLLYQIGCDEYLKDKDQGKNGWWNDMLRSESNQINNRSFTKYTTLNEAQHYWISVDTDNTLFSQRGLNVRKIKLPKELIEISDDLTEEVKEICQYFPSIDMYRPGYVPITIQQHIKKK